MRISDWSSDVCSSDLIELERPIRERRPRFEVEPAVERRGGVVRRQVIGEHVAAEAPVVAQYVAQQERIFAGVGAVDARIRAHDGADVRFLDRGLRSRQMDLALRAFVDDDVDQYARAEQAGEWRRSEEHTSELQSLMRITYAVFCLKKKKQK